MKLFSKKTRGKSSNTYLAIDFFFVGPEEGGNSKILGIRNIVGLVCVTSSCKEPKPTIKYSIVKYLFIILKSLSISRKT